ncbi:MAG: ABC transporter ATP-binding protein [Nitrospinota bacterium]|nr:ABC transporter ATP-binding protein [Nitrospinota bacterium]HJN03424.1 ABC transporter ATP-binding protein [Nitrospinota bacterium]
MIQLKDITKLYNRGKLKVKVLKGVSLSIKKGEYVSIMAPSGAGKSTLMNIIGCLDTPTSGTYFLDNDEISGLNDSRLSAIRNSKIGFVFQAYNLLSGVNAIRNVMLPLIYRNKYPPDAGDRAEKMLKLVGLQDRLSHSPGELSGGEQQRVAIARALICEPSVLLADEPTGNLDSNSGREILSTFDQLHQVGKTIVLITHDQNAANHAKRIIRMRDGLITEDTSS